MDVLHLVTSNNTIINTNNKQTIEYNISTIQSILSIPHIHVFQRNHIAIHTFGTFRIIFNHFESIFSQTGIYSIIKLSVNGHFPKLL